MEILQNNFLGGMVSAVDATKTPAGAYRIGINCRVRDNAFVGAYRPIRIASPDTIHQAVFTLDDTLLVVIGGRLYKLIDSVLQEVNNFPNMSAAVDTVYHEAVPAPTNFFMQTGGSAEVYNTVISTFSECIILQDGRTQPALVLPGLGSRRALTYAQWSFTQPEYVPIGLQMAWSGKKLYTVSADGKRVYQSVSGRPLDHVLNIVSATGAKGGDADTTYVAATAARTTACIPAQGGGFLLFTQYQALSALPDGNFPEIFGEPYISPNSLFPVGAVGQYAFTFANGESLFVSPEGIQSFNQVMQQMRESNNTPFGAPIQPYIVRPIDRAACCTVDDYVFIGVTTIFGDGMLVYDTQLSKFISVDLVGKVKEFAILRGAGTTRLFFITEANELFEQPLYAGERAVYGVYFGEHSSQIPNTRIKGEAVRLALTDIKSAGDITVRVFANRRPVSTNIIGITAQRPADNNIGAVPLSFSLADTAETTPVTAHLSDLAYEYTYGVEVTCSADCKLSALQVEYSEQTVPRPVIPEGLQSDKLQQVFLALGNIRYDSVVTGDTSMAAVVGRMYTLFAPSTTCELNNGGRIVRATAGQAVRFTATTDRLTMNAAAEVYDFTTVSALLNRNVQPAVNVPVTNKLLILGNTSPTQYHAPVWSVFEQFGYNEIMGVKGREEYTDIATSADYAAHAGVAVRSVHSTDYVDFYLLNIDATDAANLAEDGPFGRWLQQEIALRDSGKFIVVLVGTPPYSNTTTYTPGTADLRWNFRRFGVDMVLSTAAAYERFVENNVYYINVGTGNATGLEDTSAGLAVPGVLELTATPTVLSTIFYDNNGKCADRISIVG